jgi:uncharacterized membrane protein YfhO
LIGAGAPGGVDAEPGPCAISGPRPEQVTLRCSSPHGGYAVLLDAWAPGWTATVDGRPAAIVRADVLARAVRVGPGDHVVELRYRAPGLRLGAVVSLAAWLGALALGLRLRRRR